MCNERWFRSLVNSESEDSGMVRKSKRLGKYEALMYYISVVSKASEFPIDKATSQ